MFFLKTDKLIRVVLASCLGIIMMLPMQAQASLVGDSVAVGFPSGSAVDNVTVVADPSHPEIVSDDGSFIGRNVLALGEFIDIGESSIVYHAQGSSLGLTTINNLDYTSLDYGSGDKFVFYGFDFSGIPNAILSGVTVSLVDIANVELGTDVEFDAYSVTLNLDRILVRYLNNGEPNFGSIRLDLEFTAAPVPLPSGFVLLASGLALLSRGLLSKREKRV